MLVQFCDGSGKKTALQPGGADFEGLIPPAGRAQGEEVVRRVGFILQNTACSAEAARPEDVV